MRSYNAVSFFFGILLFLFSSCKKKEEAKNLVDLSPGGDIELRHIVHVGNNYFIAGGVKFNESALYRLSEAGLYRIPLPTSNTGNLLYKMACNTAGHMVAVGDNAAIYYSTDSGASWQFNREVLWYEYTGVTFCGEDSLLLSGKNTIKSGVTVLCGNDGTHKRGPDTQQLFELDDIQYLNAGIAYTCGYGAVMKTKDQGITWEFTDAKNDFFKAMYWKNEQEGIVVGYQGSILKTTDGGNHFTTYRSANNPLIKHYHWLGIHGNIDTRVVVGERGAIVYSHDGGDTWSFLKPFTSEDLHSVYVINDHQVLVCGTGGSLFQVEF